MINACMPSSRDECIIEIYFLPIIPPTEYGSVTKPSNKPQRDCPEEGSCHEIDFEYEHKLSGI